MASDPSRIKLRREAILLQYGVIGYNVFECLLALVIGSRIHSIALLGFGLDGGLEITSSVAILAHLKRNGRTAGSVWEERVARFIGVLLLLLAFFIFNDAMLRLIYRIKPQGSFVAVALACLSLIVMSKVATKERLQAIGLDSAALRVESRETLICAWLSLALLIGLGANLVFGLWWVDSAVAIMMATFIAREGLEAFSGDESAHETSEAAVENMLPPRLRRLLRKIATATGF